MGPPPGQGSHGGGGYPPGGPGSGLDPQVQQWFNAVDQDRSGQIDFKELQRALVNGNWSNFSEEACRMMVDMLTGTGPVKSTFRSSPAFTDTSISGRLCLRALTETEA